MAEPSTQNGKTQKRRTKIAHKAKGYLAGSGPRPSRPLFGVLPLRRWISQDIHSILDYVGAATAAAAAIVAGTARGRAVSIGTGSVEAGASLMADYRLSAAKLLPIEMHEALDYVSGIALMTAPFALGYFKKDPVVAAMQVASGAILIGISLVTDYRAHKGVGRNVEG